MLPGLYLLLFCLLGGSRFGLISCILSGESVLYFVGSSGIKDVKRNRWKKSRSYLKLRKRKNSMNQKSVSLLRLLMRCARP